MEYRSFIPVLSLFLAGISQASAQHFLDIRSSATLTGWAFHKGDIHAAEAGGPIDERYWQDVQVPHTWNTADPLTKGPDYYQGSGWYRTTFTAPRDAAHSRVFLRFEGASSVAEVYCNGVYLGRHEGGYSAFIFELSPYVKNGETNYLSVKVNNEANRNVAPSTTSLYPIFGGIYRPVTIFTTPDVCVSPLDYASSGVYIHPSNVSKGGADVAVEVLVSRSTQQSPECNAAELRAPDGRQGLLGSYYANGKFAGNAAHERVDETIAFNYQLGAPFPDFPNDGYSATWTGEFVPKKSGTYRFYLSSDDGSRLTIGGKVVADNWGTHAADPALTGDIALAAGQPLPIKYEYYEGGGDASVSLKWVVLPDKTTTGTEILVEAVDAGGTVVASADKSGAIADAQTVTQTLNLHILEPHLWDGRRDPYLYKLRVTLTDTATGTKDVVEQPLGLRNFRVDYKDGLILNGDYYDLHGVSRHQEIEGFGPALSEKQHADDFAAMQELGCTGLRLAHYQQAEILYALSDKAGMVVWAEIPNTPVYREGNPAYLNNCKQQLTELIKQNYNHPGILFWGLYNEIPIPDQDLKELNDLAHALDPSRLTTAADLADPAPRHAIPDVQAWNKYFGWYYGDFNDYDAWYKKVRDMFPTLAAGLSEYGAGGCVSQHAVPPTRPDAWNGKFWPEEYESLYHEEVWMRIKDRHDLWCKFIWNYADFSWTNVERGDRPYINHKGLVTHDRKTRKDAFYFYKANWSAEPTVHICSSRFTERAERVVPVVVYSNLGSVELYVNGRLVSKQEVTSAIRKVEWPNVTLAEGRNEIRVIGRKGNVTLTDSCVWNYAPCADKMPE